MKNILRNISRFSSLYHSTALTWTLCDVVTCNVWWLAGDSVMY